MILASAPGCAQVGVYGVVLNKPLRQSLCV